MEEGPGLSPEASAHNAKFGEEVWKAAESPMFTRLWSYDELLTVVRPIGFSSARRPKGPGAHEGVERPDNWPDDTQVYTGNWVFWLPEGWIQGIRTQVASGKILMCYMSPVGKRFWHKKKIEEFLGKELATFEPPEKVKKEGEDGKTTYVPRVRFVTDPDAIPKWPDEGEIQEIHVPNDFKLAFRQLPSGLHPIWIPPGKEDEGFLYQKHLIPQWLSGALTTVSAFGTSKPMASVSAGAKARKSEKKRKAEYEDLPATLADFKASTSVKIIRLEGSSDTYAAALGEALRDAAGAPDPALVATDAQRIGEKLLGRGFRSVDLIYAFSAPDSKDPHPVGAVLSGFYYKKADPWEGKPLYQSIALQESARAGVVGGHAHLFWSPSCAGGGRWKIGQLTAGDEFAGCLALSAGTEMSGQWLLAPLE